MKFETCHDNHGNFCTNSTMDDFDEFVTAADPQPATQPEQDPVASFNESFCF